MLWTDLPLTVMDFEGCARTGVVEFGVVKLYGGRIVDTHTRLCRPRAPIDPAEARLHGIRQGEAADFAPFEAEWERFAQARREGLFVAHHACVESGLLRKNWPYPPLSPGFGIVPDAADWGPWLDTRRICEAAWPGLESYGLGALLAALQLEDPLQSLAETFCPETRRKAHCALYDALASALLLLTLGRADGFADMPLAWLIDISVASPSHQQPELF
ncbi:MAG: exonuclease domain-containing protein [Opitutales bacterium]